MSINHSKLISSLALRKLAHRLHKTARWHHHWVGQRHLHRIHRCQTLASFQFKGIGLHRGQQVLWLTGPNLESCQVRSMILRTSKKHLTAALMTERVPSLTDQHLTSKSTQRSLKRSLCSRMLTVWTAIIVMMKMLLTSKTKAIVASHSPWTQASSTPIKKRRKLSKEKVPFQTLLSVVIKIARVHLMRHYHRSMLSVARIVILSKLHWRRGILASRSKWADCPFWIHKEIIEIVSRYPLWDPSIRVPILTWLRLKKLIAHKALSPLKTMTKRTNLCWTSQSSPASPRRT